MLKGAKSAGSNSSPEFECGSMQRVKEEFQDQINSWRRVQQKMDLMRLEGSSGTPARFRFKKTRAKANAPT